MSVEQTQAASPWPHRLAVVLVCATFPLIWVGGLVTTYDAGMAVPDWPTTYGYNLFLYPWQTWVLGPFDLFIEHGHRLLGAVVGLLTIALVAALFRCDARRWVRYLGLLALATVVVQGILGGMRVLMDERLLAQIHASLAPAFFAIATTLAVVTSRPWSTTTNPVSSFSVTRLATATTALSYVQILLGAALRHMPVFAEGNRFRLIVISHLVLAVAVVGHIIWLACRVATVQWTGISPRFPAYALVALVLMQVSLGIFAWATNFGWPSWLGGFEWAAAYTVTARSPTQACITTLHQAGGSLILAISTTVMLRAWRAGLDANTSATLDSSPGLALKESR
jgi:cytochrome c oxidase assembly protein subunit 15